MIQLIGLLLTFNSLLNTVYGYDQCQGYYTKSGTYIWGQNCDFYCCGSCYDRYCCSSESSRLDQSVCTNWYPSSSSLFWYWWLVISIGIIIVISIAVAVPIFIIRNRRLRNANLAYSPGRGVATVPTLYTSSYLAKNNNMPNYSNYTPRQSNYIPNNSQNMPTTYSNSQPNNEISPSNYQVGGYPQQSIQQSYTVRVVTVPTLYTSSYLAKNNILTYSNLQPIYEASPSNYPVGVYQQQAIQQNYPPHNVYTMAYSSENQHTRVLNERHENVTTTNPHGQTSSSGFSNPGYDPDFTY